jgi:hypothetical protein
MEPSDYSTIERFYEASILPRYRIVFSNITWTDHGRIGDGVFAHYFTSGNVRYVLVFEDYPSQPHFIAQDNELIPAPNTENGAIAYPAHQTIEKEYIENVTGYFTLFKEN